MSNNIEIFIAGDFCSKPSTQHIKVDDKLKNIIQGADISIINFEVPLKPTIDLPVDGYERFFQNDDAPEFLKSLGFNLFATANNHMFDWGDEGYQKVRESLGDSMFGAGRYNEAYTVKIIEVKGKKIGFLALTFSARRGVFNDPLNKTGYACAHLFDLNVNHIIVSAKKEVDYLFILPHAGIEYCDIPTPELIAKYRDFVEWGADGVIASHPHCPQGWEQYNGKPIFYSLGNFFFNSKPIVDFVAKRPHWYNGLAVVIDINENGIQTEVINTVNVRNRELKIDDSIEISKHNAYLCELLADKDMYTDYLQKMMIAMEDTNLRTLSLGALLGSIKNLIKINYSFLKGVITRRRNGQIQGIKAILNDEIRTDFIRRTIKNK